MHGSKRVLFVAYGGGHISMVLPVMRALRERQPDVRIDLVAPTTAYSAAQAAGEKSWRYADLKHLADAGFADEWGARLAPEHGHPSVSQEEARAYTGVNLWDLVQQHGREKAMALHAARGRFSYFPLNFFKRVIAHFQPDAVVATNSPRSEEAALQAARELGVPTLSMTDYFLRPSDAYCKRPVFADCVTVLDRQSRDTLVASGLPPGKVLVTGNAAFDGLASDERREQARAFRHGLGWERKTVVLWAGHLDDYTSTPPDLAKATPYPLAVETELRKWVRGAEDRALIVRYHPNEMHWFPPQPAQSRVFQSTHAQHVHEAIVASDLVVVQMSTVGLEAAVAGKPVVAMVNSPQSLLAGFNYEDLGVAYAAPDISKLPAYLAHALKSGCKNSGLSLREPAAPIIAKAIFHLIAVADPSLRRSTDVATQSLDSSV